MLNVLAKLDLLNSNVNIRYDALTRRESYLWTVGGIVLILLFVHSGASLLTLLGLLTALLAVVGRGWYLFRPLPPVDEVGQILNETEGTTTDTDGG